MTEEKTRSTWQLGGAIAGNVAVTLALVTLPIRAATSATGPGLSAIPREMTGLAAVVAVTATAATESASTTARLGAITRKMAWLAAVVAVATTPAATTSASLRALSRNMSLLVAVVASHR